ncbi:unnamed protein product [Leptidea sinapis]|uniref:Uncharacterized protein n=1 Tax=Leptidea sinapis TaxID=189913 RepID=A0A5E4PZ27_9NEOP|nr:unnamed protein product [Leptidea sinapis]
MDLVARDLRALTKSYSKLRTELADFQSLNLENRQVFITNEGVKRKRLVHLNGIGKWKGRHITSTVRLVAGPYDPLLEQWTL